VDARFAVIEGGPHAIVWTHADEVNEALLSFLGKGAITEASTTAEAPVIH
jgi:hypothetical protein